MKIKAGENNTAKLLTFSSLIPLLIFSGENNTGYVFFSFCFLPDMIRICARFFPGQEYLARQSKLFQISGQIFRQISFLFILTI
ncbi:hypothetical protein CB413_26090 [Salmonella enterica subsp. enterica serovar Panama]|nr:hypothetical protein [Salmonella enterica subsp. enterica serovar Panama]